VGTKFAYLMLKILGRDVRDHGTLGFSRLQGQCSGGYDVGHSVYDPLRPGRSFDQKKGSISITKYGKQKTTTVPCGQKPPKEAGIRVYADVVLNHKMGADNFGRSGTSRHP